MEETKYIVEMDGQIVARDMILKDAVILIKGLAQEYYKQMEYGGEITLKEEPRVKEKDYDKSSDY